MGCPMVLWEYELDSCAYQRGVAALAAGVESARAVRTRMISRVLCRIVSHLLRWRGFLFEFTIPTPRMHARQIPHHRNSWQRNTRFIFGRYGSFRQGEKGEGRRGKEWEGEGKGKGEWEKTGRKEKPKL